MFKLLIDFYHLKFIYQFYIHFKVSKKITITNLKIILYII